MAATYVFAVTGIGQAREGGGGHCRGWVWSRARACCRCAPPYPKSVRGRTVTRARRGGGGGGLQPYSRRSRANGSDNPRMGPAAGTALGAALSRLDALRVLRLECATPSPPRRASHAPGPLSGARSSACAQQQAYWVAGPPAGCKVTESPNPSCLQTDSQRIPIPSARIARLTLLSDPAALQQRWPQRLRRTRHRRRPGGPHLPLRPRPPVKPRRRRGNRRRRSLTEVVGGSSVLGIVGGNMDVV